MVTAGGDFDPARRFFTHGSCDELIDCPTEAAETARDVGRLMVEGGGVHTQFLAEGLADELQLTVAPFFVRDSRARRFVDDGRFPWCSEHRARLVETRPVGDVVLLRYTLSDRCDADRVPVGRSEAV